MGEDYEEDWPKKGDKLFRSDLPDFQHNAVIGGLAALGDISDWAHYIDGYREAGRYVAEAILEKQGTVDTLLYPVVFLYRHHIELALKTIVLLGARMFEEEEQVSHQHDLLPLWKRARSYLARHWSDQADFLNASEELIKELDAFDSGSYAFRYPVDTEGANSLPGISRANVRHFAYTADKLADFLISCYGGLWDDLDQKEQFLSDMRAMYDNDGW